MRSNQGFLLITVLLISVVLLLLVFGASVTSLIDRQSAANQRAGSESYYVAKAGIEHFKAVTLNALHEGYGSETEDRFVCESPVAETMVFADGVELLAGQAEDGSEHKLRFELDGSNEYYELSYNVHADLIFLRSVGHAGRSQSSVQVVATVGAGPAGVWDNAVFANEVIPKSGKVNGTVSSYGSIHIVNGDITVDEDQALDVDGNAGIYNNYAGSGESQTEVYVESNNVFTDEDMKVQDLCTRVKIAEGDLQVGQTNKSRVGADSTEDPNPNRIEGIYLGDDGRLMSKDKEVEPTEENSIYSRNTEVGSYDPYDLEMPKFPSPYPPPDEHDDVMHVNSAECDSELIDTSSGTPMLTLPPTEANGPSTCSTSDGTPIFTWEDGILTISEAADGKQVAFPEGGLHITDTVRYKGAASLMFGSDETTVNGDILVEGSFVPDGGDYLGNPDDPDDIGSTIALTTNNNATLDISESPDLEGNDPVVASMVFAKETITVEHSLAVFGALVGKAVETKAVPSVAHNNWVASVAEALKLPGSNCDEESNNCNPGQFTNLSEERN